MAMNCFSSAIMGLALTAMPALAADYDNAEKSPLYELHLRVPASAMAIPPLKDRILTLYKTDADQTTWRVTFENETVLSLSAETYADTGGAHPNSGFQTIVWDKKADRAVPIVDFQTVAKVFLDPYVIELDDSDVTEELRFNAVGLVDGRMLFVTYTMRGAIVRIISAGGAQPHEKRKYHEL